MIGQQPEQKDDKSHLGHQGPQSAGDQKSIDGKEIGRRRRVEAPLWS